MLSSINVEQRLYVIEAGKGFSCLGFDVVRKRTQQIAAWLNYQHGLSDNLPLGSDKAYMEYNRAMILGAEHAKYTGKRCEAELEPQLIGLEGWLVEVVDSYGEKRRFIVGKSTGWLPCHLEIAKRNSSGGPAVMGAPFSALRKIEKIR